MSEQDAASFQFKAINEGESSLRISGRLEAATVTKLWPGVIPPIEKAPPSQLQVDLSDVSYCDGTGIGLFVELDRQVRGHGGTITFEHVDEQLQKILNLALLKDPAATLKSASDQEGSITQIGRSTALILDDVKSIIEFTGELAAVLPWVMMHPHRVRWRDTFLVAEKTGANAVLVVCLLGFLVGLIIAFQCAAPMRALGAESMVPTVVAIAIVSELGPLMAAIILAGRSGSAFAAEIGTMKVTEEINALQTFGLSPMKFLVVPRVLASLAVTPMLSVFSSIMGVVGGYVVMAALGYSLAFYLDQITNAVDYVDFLKGVGKSFVFAILVAGIGCLRGLRTQSGPGAVGDSTTRAVVAGIVLIVFADAIMGACLYYLGI